MASASSGIGAFYGSGVAHDPAAAAQQTEQSQYLTWAAIAGLALIVVLATRRKK